MNGAIGEHLSVTDWEHCRITVVIPTYNEADNLPAMTEALLRLALPNMQVLIVDDNSPDGTGAVADELAARFNAGLGEEQRPRLLVMHRQGKGGLGTAYVAGMSRAIADGADYIVQMDADFSHSPRYLPQMLGVLLATEADVVIGSRYVPGGAVVGSPPGRKFISYAANWLAHTILGIAAHDCTAGFRCYRRSVLETIDLDSIFSSGYSFLIEMAFHCQRAGFRIGEVPITFVNRTEGASKINRREIYKAFYTLLRLRTALLPWAQIEAAYRRRYPSV